MEVVMNERTDPGTTNLADELTRLGGDPARGASAPHAYVPETGTPAYSKGPPPPEQHGIEHELDEGQQAERARAEPAGPPSRGTSPPIEVDEE
jgi:hypothetical protein